MNLIECPDYKKHAGQMGLEHYVPKRKVIPGTRMRWTSYDSPSLRETHPHSPAPLEKDIAPVMKAMDFPLVILAGAIILPFIVMIEQPSRIANSKFGTSLWLDELHYTACLNLAYEFDCFFILGINPFSSILADVLGIIISSVKHLALGTWYLPAGAFTG
ncbi:MAG: hypothetical protein OXI16_02260 [Chloroflexota bacterium]|nr:hypothetical protein [Chloroflexota bacterium]